MKKMLVSDYDGTLYINKSDIEKNVEMIKRFRKNGNIFVIATGRAYDSIMRKVNRFSIPYDYIITQHGSAVFNENEKMINEIEIEEEIIKKVMEHLNMSESDFAVEVFNSLGKCEIETPDILRISINLNTCEEMYKMKEYVLNKFCGDLNVYAVWGEGYNLVECISADVNKAIAINKIVRKKNVNPEDVFVIGDGENDIEMIKAFNGYTMEKVRSSNIKEVSKGEYPSVSDLILKLNR